MYDARGVLFSQRRWSTGQRSGIPLEERFLQVLFPPAKKDALAQIRTILGVSAFVHAPLRGEGDICGVLVMMGSQLTERDVLTVVAFAHQLMDYLRAH